MVIPLTHYLIMAIYKTGLNHAEVTQVTTESIDGKAICRLSVTSRPTKDSDIRIEVWIPQGAAWNGKFVQVGNGGFAGSIPSAATSRNTTIRAVAMGSIARLSHQATSSPQLWLSL